MKNKLRVAVLQWDVREGDPAHNRTKLRDLAARAAAQKADLALIPEMWYSGYDYGQLQRFASGLEDGAFAAMAELASEFGMAVGGTAGESEDDRIYNTFALVAPDGELVLSYRKIFLFGPMGETSHFTPGEIPVSGEYLGWRLGVAVCYDLRFPELFRKLMQEPLDLFLISAQWPATRISHWNLLLRARAIENQIYVAGCNRIGETPAYQFPGQSAIIDFLGQPLVQAYDQEGVWVAEIDKEELSLYRAKLPFLKDRKEEWI